MIDVDGNVTAHFYDPFGRLVRLADPDTGESQLVYNGFGQLLRRPAPTARRSSARTTRSVA